MTSQTHYIATLTTTEDPYYPGHPGYYAECEDCGPLGQPTDDPRDAHRIGSWHLAAMHARAEKAVGSWSQIGARAADTAALYRVWREVDAERGGKNLDHFDECIDALRLVAANCSAHAQTEALRAKSILSRV